MNGRIQQLDDEIDQKASDMGLNTLITQFQSSHTDITNLINSKADNDWTKKLLDELLNSISRLNSIKADRDEIVEIKETTVKAEALVTKLSLVNDERVRDYFTRGEISFLLQNKVDKSELENTVNSIVTTQISSSRPKSHQTTRRLSTSPSHNTVTEFSNVASTSMPAPSLLIDITGNLPSLTMRRRSSLGFLNPSITNEQGRSFGDQPSTSALWEMNPEITKDINIDRPSSQYVDSSKNTYSQNHTSTVSSLEVGHHFSNDFKKYTTYKNKNPYPTFKPLDIHVSDDLDSNSSSERSLEDNEANLNATYNTKLESLSSNPVEIESHSNQIDSQAINHLSSNGKGVTFLDSLQSEDVDTKLSHFQSSIQSKLQGKSFVLPAAPHFPKILGNTNYLDEKEFESRLNKKTQMIVNYQVQESSL